MTALWRFLITDPGFALANAALVVLAVVVAAWREALREERD